MSSSFTNKNENAIPTPSLFGEVIKKNINFFINN